MSLPPQGHSSVTLIFSLSLSILMSPTVDLVSSGIIFEVSPRVVRVSVKNPGRVPAYFLFFPEFQASSPKDHIQTPI